MTDFNVGGRTELPSQLSTSPKVVWPMSGTSVMGVIDKPLLVNISLAMKELQDGGSGDFDGDGKRGVVLLQRLDRIERNLA